MGNILNSIKETFGFKKSLEEPIVLDYLNGTEPRRKSRGEIHQLSDTYFEGGYIKQGQLFVLFKDSENPKLGFIEYRVRECRGGGDLMYGPYGIFLKKIGELSVVEYKQKYGYLINN